MHRPRQNGRLGLRQAIVQHWRCLGWPLVAGQLLTCWSSLGCASSDLPASVEDKAVARLKACGLVTSGRLLLPQEGERAQCQLQCLAKLRSCADVETAFCRQDWQVANDCLHACYSSHICAGVRIPSDALCDGRVDCLGGTDEAACDPDSLKDCKEGEVVHSSQWCDDHIDCATHNDELFCDDAPRFSCKNGTTIPAQKECDGELDCAVFANGPSYQLIHDGSDEVHCPGADFFACGDGSYLEKNKLCDSHNDCAGGQDEPIDCAANTCPILPQ